VTAGGDTLVRKQTFGIYLRGITLFQEFCDVFSGRCSTDIEQTRFFDDSLNPHSIKWSNIEKSKEYADPVAKARAVEELSFKMSKVCWVFFLFSFIPVLARTVPIGWECCHWSELTYSGAALLNAIALLMLYISIGLIHTELEELRLVAAEYPLITIASNKAVIEFKWGSSFWLAFCCTIPYTMSLYIIWLAFPVDPELDLNSQKAVDRAKRTSAYLSDVSNTSHIVESRPQDTVNSMFHSNIKMGGWTSKVESVPLNDFTLGLNKSPPEVLRHSAKIAVMAADDGPINDIPMPQKEAEFSGTLEWQAPLQQLSKQRRASAKEKSPVKKERRSTMSEAVTPPPPPKGKARAKVRRSTLSEGVAMPPPAEESLVLPGITMGMPTMGVIPPRIGPHVGVLPTHPARPRRGSVSEIQTRERKVTRAPRPPKQIPSTE